MAQVSSEAMEQAKATCNHVAQEVLMTERAYVANLRNLYELYYKRLHLACFFPKGHPQRFLELDVVMRIFSNIEDLVLINEELLDALERNAASGAPQIDQALQIGAIFHKMAFALILYRKYLANYNTANRTLKQLESNTRFVEWLAKTEEDSSDQLRGQRLPSLLIQPVQRIPRYRMLLEELLKQYGKFQAADVGSQLDQIAGALDTSNTWLAKHQEQSKVDNAVREMREACEKIGEVANTVNEAIRENEQLEELFEIQESMKNLDGRTLMDLDRWLLKRGDIFKVTRKDVRKYHLMLFSDIILTTTETATGSNIYKLHQWIELKNPATSVTDITPAQIAAQAKMLTSHGLNPTNAFFLNSSAKSFEIVCEGDPVEAVQEKTEWLDMINEAIAERRGDAEGDEEWAAEVAAAVWTPNAETCHVCERRFSYKLRRHHCRACGCNVCGACSAYKRERTVTGSSSDLMGKVTETKVLTERICSVCAKVETPRKEGSDATEAESEPGPANSETVLARYKCVKKSQIRAQFEMDSSKVGQLDVGKVIDVYEVRTNDDTGVSRVRFSQGWVSVETGAGVVVLQKLDNEDKQNAGGKTASAIPDVSVAPLDLKVVEAAVDTDEVVHRPAPRSGHTRQQLSLTRGSSGLGLEVNESAVVARFTIENGPGEAAGVKPGWRIVAINGIQTDDKDAVVEAITMSPSSAALLFDFDVPENTARPTPPSRPGSSSLGVVPDRPSPKPASSAPLPAGLATVRRTPIQLACEEDDGDDDSSSGSEEEDLALAAASGLTPTPRVQMQVDLGLTRLPPEERGSSGEAGSHTLAELQAGMVEGVDPTRKEDYLSDAEFLSAMGMSRAQFAECKKWKQTSMKKKIGIY